MARVDELVDNFLAQKRVAVVGVSDRRDTGCNEAYRRFKNNGYEVFAVNPRITEFEGDRVFPDLRSLPETPEGVFILANPSVTDEIAEQCVEVGVKSVWMHCMMGTKPGLVSGMTSVSQRAVDMCRANGIEVIPGTCPNQFLDADVGHLLMRKLWRGLGFMNIQEDGASA